MSTKNMSASAHARLLNIARATRKPFNELLQLYGIERFLYRLSQSDYQSTFVLKGALVFVAWGAAQSRPTKDVDLLGYGNNRVAELVNIIRNVCLTPVTDDGLSFDVDSIKGYRIKEGAQYEGVRLTLLAYLGSARIPMQIDVGFGDIVIPAPTILDYPTLLALPAPQLRGYPPEAVIAEKFQALVNLGEFNSRMKDFYDLWLLSQKFEFDGQQLLLAITNTFTQRSTPLPSSVPIGLSNDFGHAMETQWQAFLRRARLDANSTQFSAILATLRTFLDLTQMKNRYWKSNRWASV